MLKFKTLKFSFFILLLTMLYSFIGDKIQKRVIRDANFDTHFYVYIDEKKTNRDVLYFWFKSGKIHESFGDAGGDLLHNEFTQYYTGNQLAEKGKFNYGLKVGLWRKWHPNGNLKEEVHWRSGKKNGHYRLYDLTGKPQVVGQYRSGTRNGVWINVHESDTTWYRKGIPYKEHPRVIKKRLDSINGKESIFKKIFRKKDSTAIDANRKPFFKRVFTKQEMPTTTSVKKPSLLRRIFKKKNDTVN